MSVSRDRTNAFVYRRVLGYTRPYALRFAIGLLAGLIAGGSLFALLQLSPELIKPFEGGSDAAMEETAEPTPDEGSVAPVERLAQGRRC